MYLFTSVQTIVMEEVGNYPKRDVQEWSNSTSYGALEEVAVYDYNGKPYNNVYVSLTDNNQGNFPPSLGEFWTYKEKVSMYRPVQPTPTSHIMRINGLIYGVKTSNATHILIMGVFGRTMRVEQLDNAGGSVNLGWINVDPTINKYVFQMRRIEDVQRIRITISSLTPTNYSGFTLTRGLVEHDLGTDTLKCQKCESARIYTKKTSSYSDNGVKIYGTNQIIEDKKVAMTIDKSKRDELKALLSQVIDTPIFMCKDLTRAEVGNGIYGYYSIVDMVEDCKTGNYSFSGQVQSYPYQPPQTINDSIYAPIIIDCIASSSPHDDMRGITVRTGDFLYDSPKTKYHHSTDWVLKDSGGTVIDQLPMRTGVNKYLYVKRLNAGTYTIEVKYRDQFGNISPTATKTITVGDVCYSLCPNIFGDDSLVFHLPFDQQNNPQREVFGGGTWTTQNITTAIRAKGGDNCYSTYPRKDNVYTDVDNKATIPFRFDIDHNTEMTLTFFGYFMKNSSEYCYPYVIKFGSLILAMCVSHTGDSYPNCVAWLESNTERGLGSPMLDLQYGSQFSFDHYAFYVNLMTRTLKFYVNGVLKKEFYNISNNGTSHNFSDEYSLGTCPTGKCNSNPTMRGTVRSLAVFNRELTTDELLQLQKSERNV